MTTVSAWECALCGRSDQETPLTLWRYRRQDLAVCPNCMPAFIHHTEDALAQWQARRSDQAEGQNASR